MSWITPASDGCVLTVKATPRANRTEIAGVDADWLRIRIQAPPVDGKANEELTRFLSEKFDLPKRAVQILSGDGGRLKRVKLCGITAEAIASLINKESE